MTQCGILPRRDLEAITGCTLPIGHAGAHNALVKHYGAILWETDHECDCDNCHSEDCADWCVVWWSERSAA